MTRIIFFNGKEYTVYASKFFNKTQFLKKYKIESNIYKDFFLYSENDISIKTFFKV